MTFDSPTDKAGILTTTWACTRLFTFRGASSSICSWLNATSVSASFPAINNVANSVANSVGYLNTSDFITLQDGLLRAYCTSDAATCLSNLPAVSARVPTLFPSNPLSPTVIINAPNSLGSCSNLSLDATGSYGNGGRLYKSVVWTVVAVDYSSHVAVSDTSRALALQTYLNDYSLVNQVFMPITISQSSLVGASYIFTLTLTNFLGLYRASSAIVNVNTKSNVPVLTIIGPLYQTIVASSPLTILSTASLPTCASQSSKITYAWTVSLAGVSITPLESTSSDPSQFHLPAYSLIVDKTYDIMVSATADSVTSSAFVTVYVQHGSVTAAVVGGYARSAPVNQILTLDASISSDADVSPSSQSDLTYQV